MDVSFSYFRFCENCLDSCENVSGSATCPVCRTGFDIHQKRKARDIERQIGFSIGTCSECNRKVLTCTSAFVCNMFTYLLRAKASENSPGN